MTCSSAPYFLPLDCKLVLCLPAGILWFDCIQRRSLVSYWRRVNHTVYSCALVRRCLEIAFPLHLPRSRQPKLALTPHLYILWTNKLFIYNHYINKANLQARIKKTRGWYYFYRFTNIYSKDIYIKIYSPLVILYIYNSVF